MNWKSLRLEFLKYFERNKHKIVDSSSLIPAQDNTILFANAGMNQFKDAFLGVQLLPYSRATTIQKCVRAGGKHNDLDQVGFTKRHLTFFEMMGNFSFGDYFKEDAIFFAWDFLTRVVGLDKEKLSITVHTSDFESKQIWMDKIGVPESKIKMLGDKDNFWQMGDTGPCGPCTEIYFDRGPMVDCTEDDQIIEIWNLVFMQFDKQPDGSLKKLTRTGVDTGMGFERLVAVCEGKETVFQTQIFSPIMQFIENATGINYSTSNAKTQAAFNVLADHIRSSCFIIADGARPSNEGRGYVLRKIIRRALLFSQKLSVKQDLFSSLVPVFIQAFAEFYPYLTNLEKQIQTTIETESEKFFGNLQKGQKLFYKIVEDCKKAKLTTISGTESFKLYDTYGFPLEVTRVLAMELGLEVDLEGFESEMVAQKKRSSAADAVLERVFNLPEGLKTKFVGYENLESKTKVVWVGEQDSSGNLFLAIEENPFFVATGGQVTDSGTVEINRVKYNLLEASSVSTGPNSKATVLKLEDLGRNSVEVGAQVIAKVDQEVRINIQRNHSATHLLHSALQNILGAHAKQAGSLVHPDYLRFLFNHPKAMSQEEIDKTEALVNQWIAQAMEGQVLNTTLEKAKEFGAESIFGEKYNPEFVRIVNLGQIDQAYKFAPEIDQTSLQISQPEQTKTQPCLNRSCFVSSELCGGTHVKNTGQIGVFKIVSEGAIGAGIRSIMAVTGVKAVEYFQNLNKIVKTLCLDFSAKPETLLEQMAKEDQKKKLLEAKLKALGLANTEFILKDIILEAQKSTKKTPLVFKSVDSEVDMQLLANKIVSNLPSSVAFIYKLNDDKCSFILNIGEESKKIFNLQDILKKIEFTGIRGGGKAFIQGTFPLDQALKIEQALETFIL